jgi:hypothetical protein
MSFQEHFVKNASVKNFTNITNDIVETIDKLEPIKYFNSNLKKYDYGFEIDSVKNNLPELISKVDTITDGIDYTSIIPILVKEIQLLKQQVKDLTVKKEKRVSIDSSTINPVFRK